MSRASDAERMVRKEAAALNFRVTAAKGGGWQVTNPDNCKSLKVPQRIVGQALRTWQGKIRRLADRPPPPLQVAVAAAPKALIQQPGDAWTVAELVAAAHRSGVSFDIEHGRLRIRADLVNRSWVDVLTRRQDEVIAFLAELAFEHGYPGPDPSPEPAVDPEPVTPQGADEPMPRIGDVARIEGTSHKENLTVDAQALYALLREEAAKQGEEKGTNARVDGVLWTGTLTSVLRSVGADWDSAYQEEVARLLRDTQHIKCQRRGNPSIWWIRAAWDDGGLTVTRKPTPADVPARKQPAEPSAPTPAAAPDPVQQPGPSPVPEEFAKFIEWAEAGRTAAATIDQLKIEIAGLRREVEEKDALLLSVRQELHADVGALQVENEQLKQELAKLENVKALMAALKGAVE